MFLLNKTKIIRQTFVVTRVILYVLLQVPLVLQGPHPPVEVGLLWVEMLRFYSLEFNMAESVISVRTSVVLSREMKDWPKKRIAIEGQKLTCTLFV